MGAVGSKNSYDVLQVPRKKSPDWKVKPPRYPILKTPEEKAIEAEIVDRVRRNSFIDPEVERRYRQEQAKAKQKSSEEDKENSNPNSKPDSKPDTIETILETIDDMARREQKKLQEKRVVEEELVERVRKQSSPDVKT